MFCTCLQLGKHDVTIDLFLPSWALTDWWIPALGPSDPLSSQHQRKHTINYAWTLMLPNIFSTSVIFRSVRALASNLSAIGDCRLQRFLRYQPTNVKTGIKVFPTHRACSDWSKKTNQQLLSITATKQLQMQITVCFPHHPPNPHPITIPSPVLVKLPNNTTTHMTK